MPGDLEQPPEDELNEPKPKEDEGSEFGKGLVICLVKFAEHAMQLQSFIQNNKKMHLKDPELFKDPVASGIELWANGASDHLYEIEVPEGEEWKDIAFMVEELKDLGLQMGHCFDRSFCTQKNAERLFKLTLDIAMAIDVKLGLKPERGQW